MVIHLVEPPLPRSYVVFLPVLAGEYPGASDPDSAKERLARVLEAGVDLFLDLTEPGELPEYAHLLPERTRHVRMPIPGGGIPTVPQKEEVVATRRPRDGSSTSTTRTALGRVGTVIGCWIGGMGFGRDPIAVLDGLRGRVDAPRGSSPTTAEQRSFVRRWAFERRRGRSQPVELGTV